MNTPCYLDMNIYELDLSIRANNVLIRNGYKTIGDILKFNSKEEILSIEWFNRKCGIEVATKLKKLSLPDNVWYEFFEE